MKRNMLNPGRYARSVILAAFLVGLSAPAAWAHPPGGRLDPDERQRLRQELRQRSGDYRQMPAGNLPAPQYPSNAMPVYPAQPTQAGPASNGRMSEDERQQLRRQLREQNGRQGFRRD